MTYVIIIAFVGFIALAVALLLPIYRMLQREEEKNSDLDSDSD